MEEAKSSAAKQQHHQQQLMMQQRQHQQHQQQMLMLQQLQKQQQQAAAMSRFPSNIDAHLRPPGLSQRPIQQNPSGATMPNLQQLQLQQQVQQQMKQQHQQQQQQQPQQQQPQQMQQQQQSQLQQQQQQQQQQQPQQQQPQQMQQQQQSQLQQQQQQQQSQLQQQQQQKMIRPGNQVELQMAYQDAWRVCHPDFKRPFSSLEDACERLLPYHVVADYEAEEDDRILDSDTTGQLPSRSQQWDHNIAAKVAEFTTTFEKQAFAFNLITRKRASGEFRNEERLMIEQALLQEEKRALVEVRQEIESREKAGREAQLRMAAMAQAEHSRVESQNHAEMMARGPIRANARGGSHQGASEMQRGLEEQDKGMMNPDEMMNGWGSSVQRGDDKEPSEDFLNDDEEENDNGEDTGGQDDWREVGEFDLNAR